MKLLRSSLLLIALTAIFTSARAQVSFGVDRTELTTDLVAGTTRTLRFNVDNPGTTSVPVTVYTEDFTVADGAPVFGQPAGPRALAARLAVFPASFELKPSETREVAVTLTAGAGPFTAGSYHAAVFVQSSRLTDGAAVGGDKRSRVVINQRLGVYFVADAQPEGRPLPADVALTALTRTPGGIALRVKNPSPYFRYVINGSLQVTPVAGGKPTALPVRAFRLLPGTDTLIEVPLPAALSGCGDCSVLAVLDYGAEELVVGEQRMKF